MKHHTRGAALIETALSVSLVLLLVLGGAQMALIAYTQLSADGAAFIATHTAAADPSASPAAVAHSVFNNIPPANITATATPNAGAGPGATAAPTLLPGTVQYSTTQTVAGFSLLPGYASTYTVGGGDVELAPSPPPSGGPAYAIGFNAVLYNYCVPGTSCSFPSTHTMYLAQTLNPGGNGVNGQFNEWGCHGQYFDNILSDFPSAMPSSITAGSELDMTTSGTDEYKVYSWDSGTPCS